MSDEEHCTEPYQIRTIREEGGMDGGERETIFVQAPNKEDVLELFNEAKNTE